jgi:valyl-tRNA synthetase
VREAFCRYYDEGMIYRGTRIVNWCPRCHTAISDLEVKHVETRTHWWYVKYPFADGSGHVVVATTRPETMLGDTAVAVSPSDERYKSLVGKKLRLPLTDRVIPIIADELVLAEFGTGAVKVTPAHDATDFEIGRKHGLETIRVIDDHARMTELAPGAYQGLSREECRKRVIADLEAQGLMEKIEPYRLSAATCERCATIIEPLVSEQWFLRMKELAAPAIEVVRDGRVKLIPERWTRVYLDWMENVRDWCISRQLWWGHRIPVFYCDECGAKMALRADPTECPKCHSARIRQDEDILDTWFSSALWPFSTMGWPQSTPDLKRFYPTDVLSTAPDIIFLWVARMIFSGLKFMGDIPFSRVYFHSFILVETGERMSRSKGIGMDPVELFEKYSTDAVRFTLTYLESQSQSYRLSEKRFELGRNFTNKVWNAARLLHPFLTEADVHHKGHKDHEASDSHHQDTKTPDSDTHHKGHQDHKDTERESLADSGQRLAVSGLDLLPVDKWILSRYARTWKTVTEALENCQYAVAASEFYAWFWHELCDWYLEFAKLRMKQNDPACRWTLTQVFRGALQLLHPMMPFITEELWQRFEFGGSIMQSRLTPPAAVDEALAGEVESMRELIVGIRNIRSEMHVPATARTDCLVNATDPARARFLLEHTELIREQARVGELKVGQAKPAHSSVVVLNGLEAYVPLEGLIDFDKERSRIDRELADLRREIERVSARLADSDFATRAKPEVVEHEQERLHDMRERAGRLQRTREGL